MALLAICSRFTLFCVTYLWGPGSFPLTPAARSLEIVPALRPSLSVVRTWKEPWSLIVPRAQVTVACREAREGIQTRDVHLQLIMYTESWPQPSWNSVLRDSDNIEVTQPSPPSTRVETTETLFPKMAPKPHLYFADVLPESLGAQTLQASFLRYKTLNPKP